MIKDECILVDAQDRITGHANKYNSHRCARQAGGSSSRAPCGGASLGLAFGQAVLPVAAGVSRRAEPRLTRSAAALPQVQPHAAQRPAAPRVQRVSVQQRKQAAAAAAGGL